MKKVTKIVTFLAIILIIILVSYLKFYANLKNSIMQNASKEKIANVVIIDKYNKMQELYQEPRKESYVEVDIIIDGNYYNNVGIRTKGEVIYDILEALGLENYSFKVKLDYIDKEQKYNGMNEIHLNSAFSDKTGIREYLVYEIYNKMGIDTQNYQFGHLYIDEMDRGLVTIAEVINEEFIKQQYNTENGNLYKPAPENIIEAKGANLRYIDDNIQSYSNIFNNIKTLNTTKEDKERLINILKNINESSETEVIEANFIDFDRIIRMVAVNSVLVNVDVFTSKTLRNYYLYEENGKIDIIPFDFELSMDPTLNPSYWSDGKDEYDLSNNENIDSRIIEIIIENEEYNNKYKQYVDETKQMLKDMNLEKVIEEMKKNTQNIIKANEKGVYSEEEYEYKIQELKKYIKERQVKKVK